MNASKETAKKARKCLVAVVKLGLPNQADIEYLHEFISAAERKLPTEASYNREKSRRRVATA